MPTLKQLSCHVEWSASGLSLPLQEYGTAYSDGLVETYIAIPPISTPFSIRLQSDGYIAPGLSMFVYIDGEYQCNRGRNNLKIPTGTTLKNQTNVDFVVRQKEEVVSGGQFLGRQWMFGKADGPNDLNLAMSSGLGRSENMGTIEVVVLRCHDSMRSKAPNPTASEMHPLAFQPPFDTSLGIMSSLSSPSTTATLNPPKGDLSDLGGLFDGATVNEQGSVAIHFGGDASWDGNEQRHGPHFDHDWNDGSPSGPQRQNTSRQRNGGSRAPSGSSMSNRNASPAIIINVNLPMANGPGPQPWRPVAGSPADSWASSRAPAGGGGGGGGSENNDGWQTWMHDTQNSNDNNNWRGLSVARTRRDRARGVPGAWGETNQGSGQDNAGWTDNTNDDPRHQTNTGGWSNNGHNDTHQDYHRDHGNNSGDNQGDWYPNGGNGNENDDGWADNGNGHDSGDNGDNWPSNGNDNQGGIGWGNYNNDNDNNDQNADCNRNQNDNTHQGGWPNDNNQDAGWWNADQNNGQNDNGWNDTGYGDNNNNNQDSGWQNNHNRNDSGDAWGNTGAGAKEPQTSTGQDWNGPADNRGGWNQGGESTDAKPVTAGGSDPTKPRSRTKSVRSNVSKQASIESAAQNTAPNAPGAWPDTSQKPAGSGPYRPGPTSLTKPYHVVSDVAGNPRIPNMQPAPAVASSPALPPPPVEPANGSFQVQRGEPALYHHKVASPKYMDSHDKPYALFVFRYRTKADLEQLLHISIPETEEMQKAELANLSKEELIERVLKTKSQLGSRMSASLHNVPASGNNPANHGNGKAGQDEAGKDSGAILNNKPAAIANQSHHSSGNSSGNKNNQAWNNVPPGSPIANNGNGYASSPPKWGGQNNNKNGNSWPASETRGGGHVEAWLNKTPAGGSVGGHQPWDGNGNASVKNGGGGSRGSNMGKQSWGSNHGKGGGIGKKGTASEKNWSWNNNGGGYGDQSVGWNGHGDNGHPNQGGYGSGQTSNWNETNGNGEDSKW
ncbi:MAG: hypothetical protein Q9179_006657 [Wetmoreana sp. 5 TL-2023]